MYESRHQRLAPLPVFRRRLFTAGTVGLGLVLGSLAIGIAGYMLTERLSFIDGFLNASMILSGMGPVHNPETTAGKLFAGCYAIYCGFAVLGIAALMFAPVVHRLFHRFHIETVEDEVKRESHPSR
ncbi:MAG TPA: hypothetical protein VFP36_05080 [Usitatibacter sp.]|nr:hypothetical protein [Usitatibacter sp.]